MDQETALISKEMLIGQIVTKYPKLVATLSKNGIHCVGCGSAVFETLEQGMKESGKTAQDIEALVETLNNMLTGAHEEAQKTEAPNVILTHGAAEKMKELMHIEKKDGYGLRFGIVPGGCSGNVYQLDFEKEATASDAVVECAGVKLFIDPESAAVANGITIDYVDSLQQSGFKIENPNATRSCGCGKSFK